MNANIANAIKKDVATSSFLIVLNSFFITLKLIDYAKKYNYSYKEN